MVAAGAVQRSAGERFRSDLEVLTGTPPTPERPLGVAVSGGGDSVALLLLAAQSYPGAVRAATVDHGLRADSRTEAEAVASLCAALSVPHAILSVQVDAGNLQAEARAARYAALRDWAPGPWVAVAHHRDDLAETLLMRIGRGAGVGGLAAMCDVRPIMDGATVQLIRPLLGWSRDELAAIAAPIGYVADPSNEADRFDRARIRKLLAAAPELAADRLAQAASNLRDAEDAIRWMLASLLPERLVEVEGAVQVRAQDLPRELRRRLARAAIDRVRLGAGLSQDWRDTGLDRLLATLDSGGIGTIAGVKASADRGEWRFEPAPPHRSL